MEKFLKYTPYLIIIVFGGIAIRNAINLVNEPNGKCIHYESSMVLRPQGYDLIVKLKDKKSEENFYVLFPIKEDGEVHGNVFEVQVVDPSNKKLVACPRSLYISINNRINYNRYNILNEVEESVFIANKSHD